MPPRVAQQSCLSWSIGPVGVGVGAGSAMIYVPWATRNHRRTPPCPRASTYFELADALTRYLFRYPANARRSRLARQVHLADVRVTHAALRVGPQPTTGG
jgi:hypothetical protein